MRKPIFWILCIGFLVVLGLSACTLFGAPTTTTSTLAPGSSPITPRNSDGAEMVLIKVGTYTIGAAESDTAARADEKPVHQVTLSDFYIYKQEVTNAMYSKCVAAGVCQAVDILRPDLADYANSTDTVDFPVVGVDWNMAKTYCAWAGGRLPTEAEWEAAARGTEARVYPWGSTTPSCDTAGMQGCSVKSQPFKDGSFAKGDTPLTLRDMGGNVWEWVNDWYSPTSYAESVSTDPVGPWTATTKVVRGGGWDSGTVDLRATARLSGDPYLSYKDVGFRCVANPLMVYANFDKTVDKHDKKTGCSVISDPTCKPSDSSPTASWEPKGYECPIDKGIFRFDIQAENSFGGTYTFTVNGTPATCLAFTSAGATLFKCTVTLPTLAVGDPVRILGVIHAPDGSVADWATLDWNFKLSETCSKPGSPVGYSLGVSVSCPASDGKQQVDFTSSLPFTLSTAKNNSVDLTCTGTDFFRHYSCNSLPPPPTPRTDGTFFYDIHGEGIGPDGKAFVQDWTVDPPVCPSSLKTPSFTLEATCQGGSPANLHVLYTPTSMIILSIVDNTGTPLVCDMVAPGELKCSGGLVGSDGMFHYSMVYSPDGATADFLDFSVPAPDGCVKPPTVEPPKFYMSAACNPKGGYLVSLEYVPVEYTILGVYDGTMSPLACTSLLPGEMSCNDSSSYPVLEYYIWYKSPTGESNVSTYPDITAPTDCATPPTSSTPIFFLSTTCDPKGGTLVAIEYAPTDITITNVLDGAGRPLTCTGYVGELQCNDSYGATVLEYAIEYTTSSGASNIYPAPDITAPTGCPTPPPTSTGWKLSQVECVAGGASDSIDFLVDVPVEGSSFVFAHVEDSLVGTYSCASTSTPNQVYCLGARPSLATVDLLAQATYFDATSLTHYFSEWPSLLPKGTCFIPTPLPPAPCSQYNDQTCPNDNTCHLVGTDCVPY